MQYAGFGIFLIDKPKKKIYTISNQTVTRRKTVESI